MLRVQPDVAEWDGLVPGRRLEGGARNDVWLGSLRGEPVVIRRSRRTPQSLAWELDLMRLLHDRDFGVPLPEPTSSGERSSECVVVQRWIGGREPTTAGDWSKVAAELKRLHRVCGDVTQRPGCEVVTDLTSASVSVDADLSAMPGNVVAVLLDVFGSVAGAPVSLIHGDPGPSNVRIGDDGRVRLLDWDESRVDVVWHDLSNLGIRVLLSAEHARAVRLSNAWEAANAWNTEVGYARRRLAHLMSPTGAMSGGEVVRPPDAVFADRRLAETYDVFEGDRDDLDAYERLVDEFGASTVLDVGCGTGEFACRLARRGVNVTGVDPAAASVEIARAKPGADQVSWMVGDACSLPPMQVDLAFMTANVAQVFLTDQDWEATLCAVGRALRPGGHLVFETRDPERRAWEQWTPAETRDAAVLPTGETVDTWCEVTGVDGEFVTFVYTNTFGSDGATITSESTLRFRQRDDIKSTLVDAGYQVIAVRDAPDRPGREMVFIARHN